MIRLMRGVPVRVCQPHLARIPCPDCKATADTERTRLMAEREQGPVLALQAARDYAGALTKLAAELPPYPLGEVKPVLPDGWTKTAACCWTHVSGARVIAGDARHESFYPQAVGVRLSDDRHGTLAAAMAAAEGTE